MKIEINRDDLAYAVSAVERAASNKNTLPALTAILIKAEDERITFRATDLELAIECIVSGRVLEAGEAAAPGKRLSATVRLLPGGDITLESNNEQLDIKYFGGTQTLPCFPAEEFPLLPQAEGDIQGSVSVREFRRMTKQVGIAAAIDEVRPIFSGILTELSTDSMVMVATDTRRLTRMSGAWQGSGQASLLIPNRTMQEVARLAANDDDQIIITAGAKQVFFSFANLTFTSRLIAGQFPDYHQVIPDDSAFGTSIVIDKASLTQSLERASLVSRETKQNKSGVVCFEVDSSALTVSAEVPDEGTICEKIECAVCGNSMTLSFNARYLLDLLKVLEEERVIIKLSGPSAPAVLLPDISDEQEANNSYLYLLLPMRVKR